MRKLLLVALSALLAATVLAGCADDTESANRYVQEVNRAQQRFASRLQQLTGRITSESTRESDQRTLRQVEQLIDRAVGDLRRIEPPEEVRSEHQAFIDLFNAYGEELEPLAESLDADPDEQLRANRRYVEASNRFARRVDRIIQQINRRLDQ